MSGRVIFYQLTHKFVNLAQDIPEGSKQVVYYSLAIGHHVGLMDCFHCLMEIPLDDYCQWITHLPEGAARRKMEGVLKWGEIEVNQSHASELLEAFDKSQTQWTGALVQCLQAMRNEPALYLMVRRCQ
ncbi:MAG: formate hydrogenlyase maturation protein HycH [Chloroflexi bacterium]|nr:formate hydrogenlyase maturation protein HycH [Chloroflexota bacterium]